MPRQKKTAGLFQPMAPKKAPKMPEGYYSGDKPNPNLRAFVEAALKDNPYDPATDSYDVPNFDKPIEATKATAIYNMHTYWSKKPHEAIREYIKHYTKPGDVVLDPFCGSGGTALAALMEGRRAIAIDRSPAATFITKNYCTPVDVEELQAAFDELMAKVKPEIDKLYETRCDRCGGKATTNYTVYSQVFQCPRCLEKVALFDCPEVMVGGKKKRVCPHCHERGINEVIKSQSQKYGQVPVMVGYTCENGCLPAKNERRHNDHDKKKREYFEKYDLGKLKEIERAEIPYWYPVGFNMTGFSRYQRDALRLYDVSEVKDMYTKRNLWALSIIRDSVKELTKMSDVLLFGFEAILINLSKMQGYSSNPMFPNNLFKGTYYIPQIGKEYEVLNWFSGKVNNLMKGYSKITSSDKTTTDVLISTQSAARDLNIPLNSIDYIFTDPPYADKVQYGELNFVWEAWLDLNTDWLDDEIIINKFRGKSGQDWYNGMQKAMNECYRVLKPGRCLSLCYHDTSEGTWALVQDIMAQAGFVAEKTEGALYIDTDQKSYNQLTADKVTKRDLVINYRKPRPGETTAHTSFDGADDATTFAEKARAVIRDYLDAHPGSPKDRVYDDLVSRMVRRGQMEPHDFDALLAEVADSSLDEATRVHRWYLKEAELGAVDAAETAKEDAAADSLAKFIESHAADHPEEDGVHYSQIFEHYIYAVKDMPRRHLEDILPDYFYKTDGGGWRLPEDEGEAAAKKAARAAGLGRRVKRYTAMLEQGTPITGNDVQSAATLAQWLRHCQRAGLYAQGRLIYEKGGLDLDALPEAVAVDAENDYKTCVRRLERQQKEKAAPPRRRGQK